MKTHFALVAFLFVTTGCNNPVPQVPTGEARTERVKPQTTVPLLVESSVQGASPTASSEDPRQEIGAPDEWQVSIIRQREFASDGKHIKRVILKMNTADANIPYRLALAEAQGGGSLSAQIDYTCSEGFTTYCERTFRQFPSVEDVDQFAADYNF